MSFGTSIGDVILLTQLTWKTVTNTRKACGEHDDLTQQASGLHVMLSRLQREVEKPGSLFNRRGDTYKEELGSIATGCHKVLYTLDKILHKYNALSEKERSGKKLWQQVKFGNGQIANITELRGKLTYYTSAMSLFVNMISIGSIGRVEKQMDEAGGDLKEIKLSINGITAHLLSKGNHEGSVLTAYTNDDRAVWKDFRRELVKDGFSSSTLQKHKATIRAYVTELGSRGLLDEEQEEAYLDRTNCDDGKVTLDFEVIDCDQRQRKDDEQKWTSKSAPCAGNLSDTGLEIFEERNFGSKEQKSLDRVLDRVEKVDEGKQKPTKTKSAPAFNVKQEAKDVMIDSEDEDGDIVPAADEESTGDLSGADYEKHTQDNTSLPSNDQLPVMDQGSNTRGAKFVVSPTGETKVIESSVLDKFYEIRDKFYDEYLPQYEALMRHAHSESAHHCSDFAGLSETIIQKIVLELDALNLGGNARLRTLRKMLVNKAQDVLYVLDEIAKFKVLSSRSFDKYWHMFYEKIVPECINWAIARRCQRESAKDDDFIVAERKCLWHLDIVRFHRNVELPDRISFANFVDDVKIMLYAMSLVHTSSNWKWSDESGDLKGSRIFLKIDPERRVITSRSGTRCQGCKSCPPRTVSTGLHFPRLRRSGTMPIRQPRRGDGVKSTKVKHFRMNAKAPSDSDPSSSEPENSNRDFVSPLTAISNSTRRRHYSGEHSPVRRPSLATGSSDKDYSDDYPSSSRSRTIPHRTQSERQPDSQTSGRSELLFGEEGFQASKWSSKPLFGE